MWQCQLLYTVDNYVSGEWKEHKSQFLESIHTGDEPPPDRKSVDWNHETSASQMSVSVQQLHTSQCGEPRTMRNTVHCCI